MSKPIEGVSEKIETCAKKEFLDKGYVDASLRTIAAESGNNDGVYLFPIWWKRGPFFGTCGTGSKRIYRDICKCAGKISKNRT